jgi:hypothetical protein
LSDSLEIKEISYGEFGEISTLNPRFKPGSKKVKIVLDVHAPQAQEGDGNLTSIFMKLTKLLPSLERHQCGEHLLQDLRSGKRNAYSQGLEKTTDLAHIMEHVIIDLQSNITGMNTCSGITCGYKDPGFRFDLFVECEDKRVGVFSAFFAAEVLERLLSKRELSRRYYVLVELAKYLYGKGRRLGPRKLDAAASQVSSEFGLKRSFVLPLLKTLQTFGFLNPEVSEAT